jgi:hypothetical protein
MKVVVLYRPESEHARAVESFMRDFHERNSDMAVETVNVDSREGIAMAQLYDIMRYPAILVLAGDGSLQKLWEGEELPMMDEVASYAYGG